MASETRTDKTIWRNLILFDYTCQEVSESRCELSRWKHFPFQWSSMVNSSAKALPDSISRPIRLYVTGQGLQCYNAKELWTFHLWWITYHPATFIHSTARARCHYVDKIVRFSITCIHNTSTYTSDKLCASGTEATHRLRMAYPLSPFSSHWVPYGSLDFSWQVSHGYHLPYYGNWSDHITLELICVWLRKY